MVNWIISCILIMPWLVFPITGLTEQFRAPKAAFFDIMCMGIIVFGLTNGCKFLYKNKYLGWLSGWIFITILFNWHAFIVRGTQGGFLVNIWTLEPMLHFILGLIATFVVVSSLERQDFEKIAKALCFSSMILAVVGILQFFHINPFYGFLNYVAGVHPGAFLDNPNLLGNYLALTVPLFLFFGRKYLWGLLLVVGGILVCNSEVSTIVMLIGIIIFSLLMIKNRKQLLTLILLIVIGITVFSCFSSRYLDFWAYKRYWAHVHDGDNEHMLDVVTSGRISVWKQAVPIFHKNPMFGHGLGRWKTFGIKSRGVYWIEAHNDWIERTIEIGLLGMFLFLMVIINTIKNFNYKDRLACSYMASFIGFLILMFGSFPMEIAPLALTGLISFWCLEK